MWCVLRRMKLNERRTKTVIVSMSCTIYPQSTLLSQDIRLTILKESADRVMLGVTFDAKMTFEMRFRSVSRAAAQRFDIMRESL